MEPSELSIVAADYGSIVTIDGEVDLANVDDIRDAILAALAADTRALIIDLSKTEYLDSAGIRMLFEIDEHLATRRISFRIVVPPTGMVHRVLDLTGALQHIETHPDLATAVDHSI